MQKVLWLDVETTGLDPKRHALIKIAGIVELDSEIKQEFEFKIKPIENDEISAEALEIQGLTLEQFKDKSESYLPPLQAYRELKWILDNHIDKYDKKDKFIVAGYNVGFDISFLEIFFKKMDDKYLYSYISSPVDILVVARFMSLFGSLDVENHKLETICKAMNIPLEAHNPMSDIRATRETAYRIMREINENAFIKEAVAKLE